MMANQKKNNNIFKKENATKDAYLNNSGVVMGTAGSVVTDYMEFNQGYKYHIRTHVRWRYCIYGKTKNYMGFYNLNEKVDTVLTAPEKAAYIRFCIYDDAVDTTIYEKVS